MKLTPEIHAKIIKYLNGELSEEEVKSFEKDLEKNPELNKEVNFNQQMLVSIQFQKDLNYFKDISAKLKARERKKKIIQLKWRNLGWGVIAVAAVIAILWLIVPIVPTDQNSDNSQAEVQIDNDSIDEVEIFEPEITENIQDETIRLDSSEAQQPQSEKIDNPQTQITESTILLGHKKDTLRKLAETNFIAMQTSLDEKDYWPISAKMKTNGLGGASPTVEVLTYLVVEKIKTKDYDEAFQALDSLKKLSNYQSYSLSLDFYQGIAALAIGEIEKAVTLFNHLNPKCSNENTQLAELENAEQFCQDVHFYLALAYIKNYQLDESKPLLKKIITTNSVHAKQAQELISIIDK